jgi:N-acetylmuramic acid 6-phosphate etherase
MRRTESPRGAGPLYLGIEGGGTHTVAYVADDSGRLILRAEAEPANLHLLSHTALVRLLCSLRRRLPRPVALAIGLAGARTEADRDRIRAAAARVWPGLPCYATNDLETALMAATPAHSQAGATRARAAACRVLVLAGTGSCCFGQTAAGRSAKAGGWGHLLGDRGSGYDLGLRALRTMVTHYDRCGRLSTLGHRLLRQLQMNSPEECVGWIQRAPKREIAALAVEVFAAAQAGDPLARTTIHHAGDELAAEAVTCASRLAPRREPIDFVLAGGVLLNQPSYAATVARGIRRRSPQARVRLLKRESVWGAVELAHRLARQAGESPSKPDARLESPRPRRSQSEIPYPSLAGLNQSPTERRNPRSTRLSALPLDRAIELFLREDLRIPRALLKERAKLRQAVELVERAFRRGGRLFYVGAGTSGRLGVLDASECPPTFRTSPDQVQGIMAGGQRAIWESVEGAEDDPRAGAESVRLRGVRARDVVVGIAASGRTPFVWGALWAARRRGARTVLLCFNPHLEVPPANRPELVIAVDVGPELLTGSTRLKAGTATKLVLNLLTTLAMVRLGKVISNLMVDLNPSNTKLRDRAVRIVQQLTGADPVAAQRALATSRWIVKDAVNRLAERGRSSKGQAPGS